MRLELFDDLLNRSEHQEGRLEDVLDRQRREPRNDLRRRLLAVVGDRDALDQHVELDRVEAFGRLAAHQRQAAVHLGGFEARGIDFLAAKTRLKAGEADDVGLSGCQRQEAPAVATDQDWRARTLARGRIALVLRDLIVLSLEVDRLSLEKRLDDRDGLGQALDAH